MRQIGVNEYSARWLQKGFPWVYPKEHLKGKVKPGQWAQLRGPDGKVLGTGLLDDGWILARVFGTGADPVTALSIRERLSTAAALRDVLFGPETTGYRLVHAENDALPGVRIDWWSHHAVIILDSPALAPLLPWIVTWLEERGARGVHLAYRTDPRDTRQGPPAPAPGLLAGRANTGEVKVLERGISFGVRPQEGPDVGLYADMRSVRAWLEPTWGGTRVLNTFAYTGAFSVAAAYHGASETVSVDLSSRYLDRAERNFSYNGLSLDCHEFLAEDVFKVLDRFRRQGRRFDRVILDPPSFSHSKEGTWSSKKHTPRLVAAAARVLDPGGWMLVASNQGDLSPRDFRGLVLSGLNKAKRTAQELCVLSQSPDFPAASTFPEGRHLKVAVWRLS